MNRLHTQDGPGLPPPGDALLDLDTLYGRYYRSHLEAVVSDDAKEGDDGVEDGQDTQRGLHVAAALL